MELPCKNCGVVMALCIIAFKNYTKHYTPHELKQMFLHPKFTNSIEDRCSAIREYINENDNHNNDHNHMVWNRINKQVDIINYFKKITQK